MAAAPELPVPKPAQALGTHGSLVTTIYRNGVYKGEYCSAPASQGHTAGNQPQTVVSDACLRLVMLNLSTSEETIQRKSQVESAMPRRNGSDLSEETLVEMPTTSWEEKRPVLASARTANVTTQASQAPDDCDVFLSYSSRIAASIPIHLKLQQPKSGNDCIGIVSCNTTPENATGTRDSVTLIRCPNRDSYLERLRAVAISAHQSPRQSHLEQPIDDGNREAIGVGATHGMEELRDAHWQQDGQDRLNTPMHLSTPASGVQPGSTNPDKVSTPATHQGPLSHLSITHKSQHGTRTLTQPTSAVYSEKDGGCQLTTKVDVQRVEVFGGEGSPRKETRSKTLTKTLAQVESKSKAQEDSPSAVQPGANTTVRLSPTKNAKFDSLVRKLQFKGLLGEHSRREIHVFVDMSNIYIGFQNFSKESRGYRPGMRAPYEPFSFEHFSYILERGRSIEKRHLAGSIRYAKQWNSLPRHFIDARRCGYTTKIFQQVEKPDASHGSYSSHSNSSPNTSSDECDIGLDLGTLCPRTKLGEQGVDETLHLAMQDSMLETTEPGIMVLATGDAKPAEFSDGFAHYAIKALERGWHVEIVSWRRCLSSEWRRAPFNDKYAGQVRIIEVDELFDEMKANWAEPSLHTPIST
jgi:hypothetical protein